MNASFWSFAHLFSLSLFHHRAVIENGGPPFNIRQTDLHIYYTWLLIRERGHHSQGRIKVSFYIKIHFKMKGVGGYSSCRYFAVFYNMSFSFTVLVLLFYAAIVLPARKMVPNCLWSTAEPLSREPCCQVQIPTWDGGGGGCCANAVTCDHAVIENNCQRCQTRCYRTH